MSRRAALLAEAVDLQPVGVLPPGALDAVAARLSRHVELPVHPLPHEDVPIRLVTGREQLDAGALLETLEARAAGTPRLLVGVTASDIGVALFTFVFGLARSGGPACVVSMARTDPAFYGLDADVERRDTRLVCEILHELGHLATLEHCRSGSCLMSFAGTVEKVDARGSRFCPDCAGRLPRWLQGATPLLPRF